MAEKRVFDSVWDALSDTPEDAADLQARSELMTRIAEIIKTEGWKESEAASYCRISRSRINDLLRGKISKFPLNDLTTIVNVIDPFRTH